MKKALLLVFLFFLVFVEAARAEVSCGVSINGSDLTDKSMDIIASNFQGTKGNFKVFYSYPGSVSGGAWSDNIFCFGNNDGTGKPTRCASYRNYETVGAYKVYVGVEDDIGFHVCGSSPVFDVCKSSQINFNLASNGQRQMTVSGQYLCGVSYAVEYTSGVGGTLGGMPSRIADFKISPPGTVQQLYSVPGGDFLAGTENFIRSSHRPSLTSATFSLENIASGYSGVITIKNAPFLPGDGFVPGGPAKNVIYYRSNASVTIPGSPAYTRPECLGQYWGKWQCNDRADKSKAGSCQLNAALGAINKANEADPVNYWKWSYCLSGGTNPTPTTVPTVVPTKVPTLSPTPTVVSSGTQLSGYVRDLNGRGLSGAVVRINKVNNSYGNCTGGHMGCGDVTTDASGKWTVKCSRTAGYDGILVREVKNKTGYKDSSRYPDAAGGSVWDVNTVCFKDGGTKQTISPVNFYDSL